MAATSAIVPAGAVIPANGSTAVGILYEDIDVTKRLIEAGETVLSQVEDRTIESLSNEGSKDRGAPYYYGSSMTNRTSWSDGELPDALLC